MKSLSWILQLVCILLFNERVDAQQRPVSCPYLIPPESQTIPFADVAPGQGARIAFRGFNVTVSRVFGPTPEVRVLEASVAPVVEFRADGFLITHQECAEDDEDDEDRSTALLPTASPVAASLLTTNDDAAAPPLLTSDATSFSSTITSRSVGWATLTAGMVLGSPLATSVGLAAIVSSNLLPGVGADETASDSCRESILVEIATPNWNHTAMPQSLFAGCKGQFALTISVS